MGKETFYFSHDYNCRADAKIKRLLVKHGYEGYGIFWAIIEDLYNNANALPTDYESIAYDLRTDCEKVKSIINDFDLFVISGDVFSSLSVERRLYERNQKSVKATESARERWRKARNDANAMRSHSEGNAIKESKVKESKLKDNTPIEGIGAEAPTHTPRAVKTFQERELNFYGAVAEYKDHYPREMLRAFYDYWREPNKSGSKMRWELEKTWNLNLRIQKWANNDFNKPKTNGATKQTGVNLGTSAARIEALKNW